MRLAELKAAGIPVFPFGSPALDMLHKTAQDPPVYIGYQRVHVVYGWSHHGYQYVVDHGGFFTLQTILRGQVVPASEQVIQ